MIINSTCLVPFVLSGCVCVCVEEGTDETGQCDDDDGQRKSIEDCPCERVTLELEDWSTCLMDEDHARICGRGKQFRRRKCIVTATGQLAPLQ